MPGPGFKYLKIVGAFGTLHLDPTSVITPSSPIQCPMDPSYIGNANQVLTKQKKFLKHPLAETSG